MIDLIIQNGLAVTPSSTEQVDIGIHDGLILWVATPGTMESDAVHVINAQGKLVFPGGIEPHAHIFEPMFTGWSGGEEVWLQSPEGASRAAIFGGTTTVFSFAFMDVHTRQVEFDANLAIEHRKRVFSGHSYADFAFHPVLTGTPSKNTIGTLPEAIADGSPSFKVFTTNVTADQKGIKIPNGPLFEVLEAVGKHNGIVLVHGEDDELISYREERLTAEGRDHFYNFSLVHTNLGEELAFHNVIRMAQEVNCPLYLVHVTGEGGIRELVAARQAGLPVYAETLHDLCCFTVEDYRKPNGLIYHLGTGLRTRQDNMALWKALRAGTINTMATDEYTTPLRVKLNGDTVKTATGGHVGIETRGLITFSEGYKKGRLSLERFVEVFSSNAARLLGLYPQKGAIIPGSDADLVIWNPEGKRTIQMSDLHHEGDYSPWVGWEVEGWPETTLLHGKIVVDKGRLLGSPNDGKYIKRVLKPEVQAGLIR